MNTLEPIEEITDYMDLVDRAEVALVTNFAPGNPEIRHSFCHNKGRESAYAREMILKAGEVITSRIHKTTHFYFILEGTGKVCSQDGVVDYSAGYMGITTPGTRRIIAAITDTRWVTVHVVPEASEDLKEIEQIVVEPQANPLIEEAVLLHD